MPIRTARCDLHPWPRFLSPWGISVALACAAAVLLMGEDYGGSSPLVNNFEST
jgi:hypothetical protein